jgi:uncharacterized protein YaaN involved in tellurite resistance
VPEETGAPIPNAENTALVGPVQPRTVELATLPPRSLQAAQDLAAYLDANNARCMLAFGTKPQNSLASATKAILGESTTHAANQACATLTQLLRTLRDADEAAQESAIEKFVHRIPLLGGLAGGPRKIADAYESVASEIGTIEAALHEQQMRLLTDCETLNTMFAENASFIEQLRIYIAAGQLKLEELGGQLQAMRSDPELTSDSLKLQACDDARRAIDRLSQRVYDLELTRMIALQTGPQIRLIQDGDERLANKIHTAVLTTVPLWKAQVSMATRLAHQHEAMENVRGVTDATNELLRDSSEVLKQGALDIRTQTERGGVDIDTLQATTDDLITTVEDALRISAEGREKRAEGERRLAAMEERIKSVLAAAQGDSGGS